MILTSIAMLFIRMYILMLAKITQSASQSSLRHSQIQFSFNFTTNSSRISNLQSFLSMLMNYERMYGSTLGFCVVRDLFTQSMLKLLES